MPELSPRPIPASPSKTLRDEKPNRDDIFCRGMEASAQVMVALDLGTTFSGFAYAHRSAPYDIHTFHDWPSQTEAAAAMRYCKTQTSLFYRYSSSSSSYTLQAWGWPAFVSYQKALRTLKRPRLNGTPATLYQGTSSEATFSHVHHDKITCAHMLSDGSCFVSCFKLYLAHQARAPYSSQWSCEPLPTGLSIDCLVTDYLKAFSEFVVEHLRDKYGSQLQEKEIQWCVTVPAIWTEQAKQKMKQCALNAGLAKGVLDYLEIGDPSLHPLRIVLEPEAASLYCLHRAQYSSIKEGDRFAVVDVGGATIDIVVHEKLPNNRFQVKEIARSAGCLGGGVFVDEHYLKILSSKISCLSVFLRDNQYCKMKLLRQWQSVKSSFDGQRAEIVIDLPMELAAAQAEQDGKEGLEREEDNGEVIFTHEDLCKILDPEVDKIIDLLEQQMRYNIEAILLVGGFSASPYLLKSVRKAFGARVKTIISPPNPGSTICQGAVLFSMSKEPVMSRVSRKTYGIKCTKDFVEGSDPEDCLVLSDDGDEDCENAFAIFVRVGDTVLFDQIEEHIFYPTCRKQKMLCLELYSSPEVNPCFITEEGCVKEGQIEVDISEDLQKDKRREICVSMRFGRSLIEMSAKGINFGDSHNLGTLPVRFQHAMDVVA